MAKRSRVRRKNTQQVTPDPGLLRALQVLGALGTLVLLGLGWWYHDVILWGRGDSTIKVGFLAPLVAFVFTILSLRMIDTNQVGAATCFGKPLTLLESGLQYLPFLLVQLKLGPRERDHFEAPGEPEKVFKGDDKLPLPLGKVRPIRITTGDGDPSTPPSQRRILDNRLSIIVSFYVQYAITDMLLFIANYGSLRRFREYVRDVGAAEFAEMVANLTPAQILEQSEDLNEELRKRLRREVLYSGVHVSRMQMLSPDLSHRVSTGLARVVRGVANAERTRIDAAAERDKRTEEGIGTANAKYDLLAAEAKGQKEKMDALGLTGDTVIAAETARDIAGNAETIVVGAQSGFADLIGAAKAVQTGLKTGQGATS